MTDQFKACDSCGNQIEVDWRRDGIPVHSFALPTGTNEYTTREFALCVECRRRIVDWIDECDESEIKADLLALDDAIEVLHWSADNLRETADELERTTDS